MSLFAAVPGLSIELNGVTYGNNSIIQLSEIGDGLTGSLKCTTDSTTCCRGNDNPVGGGKGEWYYPDNSPVPSPANRGNDGFYRTRGDGEIRLNRVSSNVPSGKYCCHLPNENGDTEIICANLGE